MNDGPEVTGSSAAGGEILKWRLIRRSPARTRIHGFATTLHWLARLVSDWKYRLRVALALPPLEYAQSEELKRAEQDRVRLAHEYSQGYIAGWRECFDVCMEAVEDEFASMDDVWQLGALLTGPGKSRQDN